MFRDKSAWFSSSVPQARQNIWFVEGGTITCWRKADYLFSEDASSPDTLRIFESKDYLWNKVVVFHSLFLSVCEERHSVKSVCIGHYVLPPASVQDEVREVVGRLIWESEDKPSPVQRSLGSSSCLSDACSEPSDIDSSDSEAPQCSHYPDSNKLTGYITMDKLTKYSGDLRDYHLGCFRCSNCKLSEQLTE
ncbi:telomere repeats-binding bouquet formation protein 2-like [Notolabrus celidotus]|uniref:telomere repeats-binding bouquet formation protein 2-like n=1 Tax=Notolabrus celidotus TaxID=1203425 RepID=UPI0014901580|nr:telomere repeats-binding bouquet formation protein 2-like [Notolabrus celidotus]